MTDEAPLDDVLEEEDLTPPRPRLVAGIMADLCLILLPALILLFLAGAAFDPVTAYGLRVSWTKTAAFSAGAGLWVSVTTTAQVYLLLRSGRTLGGRYLGMRTRFSAPSLLGSLRVFTVYLLLPLSLWFAGINVFTYEEANLVMWWCEEKWCFADVLAVTAWWNPVLVAVLVVVDLLPVVVSPLRPVHQYLAGTRVLSVPLSE
jgi:hypothetical protein